MRRDGAAVGQLDVRQEALVTAQDMPVGEGGEAQGAASP
jgi:hypothetical protein